MKYQLNVYGEDSEIERTEGAGFVSTATFITALKLAEEMKDKGTSYTDAFDMVVDVVGKVFPRLTKDEIMNKCDVGDVINVFKQIVLKGKEIEAKN